MLAVGTVDIPPVAAQSCGGSLYNVSSETELNDAIACVNAAGPGTHTIVITTVIFLTGSTTPINNVDTDEIIINGSGRAINAQSNGRILEIGANTTVQINDLGFQDGSAFDASSTGGGIRNFGEVTLTNGKFFGNEANRSGGGIYNRGVMTIIDSSISVSFARGEGGGIFNGGQLTIIRSAIHTNNRTLERGGGIYNDSFGTLNVINSTISGNVSGRGAGIFNQGDLNLVNTTIAANNATISGAVGGLDHTSTHIVTMSNTLIADQIAGSDCSGTIASNGHNLDSDGSCLTSPTTGDIPNGNADLLPLADNEGNTRTHALGPNSDAIDAGNNTVCNNPPVNGVDQRGVFRPQGSACDIGAYELEQDNQPPDISVDQANVPVLEAQTATNNGSVSDADGDGDTVTLTASIGTVTNNNDGTWSWSFPTSDGPSESQTVTIFADDGNGGTSQTAFDLIVNNVAPTVEAGPNATIIEGETFSASGSFTDPGADTWTATVDYGDGSGIQPLALAGNTFNLSQVYANAGSYIVNVTVTDDDGGAGADALTVTVLTPAEAIQNLIETVEGLNLQKGIDNSLDAKLEAAKQALEDMSANNDDAAINSLQAFINAIEAQRGKSLTDAEADLLIEQTQRIINSLS